MLLYELFLPHRSSRRVESGKYASAALLLRLLQDTQCHFADLMYSIWNDIQGLHSKEVVEVCVCVYIELYAYIRARPPHFMSSSLFVLEKSMRVVSLTEEMYEDKKDSN